MAFVTQLDTYALSTLAHALYYLGLTTDGGTVDNHIERIINRASDIIENALHNKIMARLNIKERHDGKGQEIIYFNQFPVIAVNLDELAWAAVTKRVTRKDPGGSFLTDGFKKDDYILVQNSDLNSGLYELGAATALTMDVAIASTIYDDTEDNNVIISHFRELWINDDKIDEDDYEVHKDHIYYNGGFSKGHGNIRMTYYGGNIALPDDVESKCLELVKKLYDKNKDIKSEKLGPYSITLFDNKANIEKEIKKELIKYANVVI